jgi:hypothetical protein
MIKTLAGRADWTPEQNEALRVWNEAQIKYSNECRLFHRIRMMLPRRGERNGSEILMFETARMRYSNAAKEYDKARARFAAIVNPVGTAAQEMIASVKKYLASYDSSLFPSIKEAREQKKQESKYANDPKVQALLNAMQKKQLTEITSKGNVEGLGVDEVLEKFETPPGKKSQ